MPGSVSVVAARLGLAGLFGDGERPRLARSAMCMLLLSLSFGGVLLGGLAQELSLGSSLFTGSAWPLVCRPGEERAEADIDDTFTGLRLSLSFSFDGVCLLGLDLGDGCMVRCPLPNALAGDVLPGVELAELEREGDGVRAAHFSGLVLRDADVREGDGSLAGLALDLDVGVVFLSRPLGGDDLVSATVLGLSRCCSLFFLGVEWEDTTRRTW